MSYRRISNACCLAVLLCAVALIGCEPSQAKPMGWDIAEYAPPLKPITPPTQEEIRRSINKGVKFLVDRQKPDGSWGTLNKTLWNIWPRSLGDFKAFQMASSALAVKALIETDAQTPEALAALELGEQWLLKKLPHYRRWDEKAIFNNWGHAYAIETLLTMLKHRPMTDERRAEVRRLVADQIRVLQMYQTIDGGWGYYTGRPHTRPPSSFGTSFLTATCMIALHHAKEEGFEISNSVVLRALRVIRRNRYPNGGFAYHLWKIPRPHLNSGQGAGTMGRSQACHLMMFLYGDDKSTPEVMRGWLTRLVTQNDWLAIARKSGNPHDKPFQVAGYYYYYGHYYAARALEHIPPADQPILRSHLAKILIKRQDADGAWWDFVLFGYHKDYGTAMGLMSLQRCLEPVEAAAAP
ncbi:MAG: prenyltransferase/squalene oxidase repeat-containing protein [Planctomycetota bacterium]|jgi:hypothetical protein